MSSEWVRQGYLPTYYTHRASECLNYDRICWRQNNGAERERERQTYMNVYLRNIYEIVSLTSNALHRPVMSRQLFWVLYHIGPVIHPICFTISFWSGCLRIGYFPPLIPALLGLSIAKTWRQADRQAYRQTAEGKVSVRNICLLSFSFSRQRLH